MKKIFVIIAFAAMFVMPSMAQQAPWKFVEMEEVTRWGKNTEYDAETCTATFKGPYDRWIDLPDLKGDLNGHTNLVINVLKSECVIRISVRYKDADGKTQQVNAATLYGQTGKPVEKAKALKIDLTNKGEITPEMLANVTSIRLSVAKPSVDKEEPWQIVFGDVMLF